MGGDWDEAYAEARTGRVELCGGQEAGWTIACDKAGWTKACADLKVGRGEPFSGATAGEINLVVK